MWLEHTSCKIGCMMKLFIILRRSTFSHSPFGITFFSFLPSPLSLSDGMSRTGVFITTMAEVERVKVQGEVDIFQTVKAARSERPHMVSTPVSRGAGRGGLWAGWSGCRWRGGRDHTIVSTEWLGVHGKMTLLTHYKFY